MRRAHDSDVGRAGQQTGATGASGTGPGTTQGAQATGSGTESPYSTTTTTASTRQRGVPEQTDYGRGAPSGGGRTSTETGTSTAHGGVLLTVAGLLTFLAGLAFVERHSFYHSASGYYYNWSIVSWGWVLFGLGIATFAAGAANLLGLPMSRAFGITMAVLTIVAGFMILVFYPLWGIIILALGAAAIWGLAQSGGSRQREYDYEYERDRQARM
jgi:hypothetical protein